ncbi:MAG TPA: 30S ribosomal protein S6, partial [Stellaceae bacterium]|nr:30S ribosomal protein S6 [Stellaceae bacterium]
YLTVRVEALEEGPSAIMQSRGRSEERDRERRPRDGYRDREPGIIEPEAAAEGAAP